MRTNYTFRKSAVEKAQYWELTEQGIVHGKTGGYEIQIAYANIQKIRLFYHPNNRFRLNNYCCKITVNQVVFDIYSCTYDGFATFGNQAEAYTSFVTELVQKTKAVNPDCKMLIGQTAATYYGNIVFAVAAVSFLFMLFTVVPVDFRNFFIVIKLIIIVYMGIYLAKSIKVNKPGQLSGTEIPAYILPQ